MTTGVIRVLVALAGSVAVFAFWCLFIVAIMTTTLYICRFIPLTGKWRRRNPRVQNLGKELRR